MSLQSIHQDFPEWSIADYTTERIGIYKEANDFVRSLCLKDRDGVVVIYMPSEAGDEYKSVEETRYLRCAPDVQSEIRKGLILDTLEDANTLWKIWKVKFPYYFTLSHFCKVFYCHL